MPENSTNGCNSGELPSDSSSSISPAGQTRKHVTSESEVSADDNSESTSVSDHSSNRASEIPSAERNHVASRPIVCTLCRLVRMRPKYVFQFLTLTATIVYGIWGIKGYIISQEALQQNKIANKFNLLNFCASDGNMSAVSEACSRVPLGPALANIASELLPNTQQVTDTVSVTKRSEPANLLNIEEEEVDFIQPPKSTASLPSSEESPMIPSPDFTVTTELPVMSTLTDTVPIVTTPLVVSSSPSTNSFDLPQSISLSDPIVPSPSTSISISPETKTSHFLPFPWSGAHFAPSLWWSTLRDFVTIAEHAAEVTTVRKGSEPANHPPTRFHCDNRNVQPNGHRTHCGDGIHL